MQGGKRTIVGPLLQQACTAPGVVQSCPELVTQGKAPVHRAGGYLLPVLLQHPSRPPTPRARVGHCGGRALQAITPSMPRAPRGQGDWRGEGESHDREAAHESRDPPPLGAGKLSQRPSPAIGHRGACGGGGASPRFSMAIG